MMRIGDVIRQEVTATVAGEYDVIVCGAGTAGCAAALAAARGGAKTLLLEASPFLGGMMTEGNAGLTNFVLHGKNLDAQTVVTKRLRENPASAQIVGGIALEFVNRLMERGAALGTAGTAGAYVYTDYQEFKILLFDMMKEAGVEVLLHSPICDALTEDGTITGVVTQTKSGRRVYLAKEFIDATGDGDVAAFAGVPFALGVGKDDSVFKQGLMQIGEQDPMGAMYRIGGVDLDRYVDFLRAHPEEFCSQRVGQQSYEEFLYAYDHGEMIVSHVMLPGKRGFMIYNYPQKGIVIGCLAVSRDYIDDAGKKVPRSALEPAHVTRTEYEMMVQGRYWVDELRKYVPGFENAFVLDTPRAGIRESRHIEGEYRLNVLDILNSVTFPDSIGKGSHPFDASGPSPKEVKERHDPDEWSFDIPYRCMVPKKIGNLLVAGKCASATREGYGFIRTTAQCMVMGEAAGTAAAMLCKEPGVQAKDIDIQELQRVLKANGAVL